CRSSLLLVRPPRPRSALFPYTTLFRSLACGVDDDHCDRQAEVLHHLGGCVLHHCGEYLSGIWFEEAGGALHPGKRRISRPAVFQIGRAHVCTPVTDPSPIPPPAC